MGIDFYVSLKLTEKLSSKVQNLFLLKKCYFFIIMTIKFLLSHKYCV